MQGIGLDALTSEIAAIRPVRPVGRVVGMTDGAMTVAGLSDAATLGDLVEVQRSTGPPLRAEVLMLTQDRATIIQDGDADKVLIGDRVILTGQCGIAPHDSWIGRILDPFGNALDEMPILRGGKTYPLRGIPVNPTRRRGLGPRLETGMAVFNTLLPIARGQRIGLFSGPGVGKTTLLARMALRVQADIVVIAMIGERARDMREFVELLLGEEGMKRAVMVAATSDMSAMARRRCAWAAMAIAEHFRDRGNHVLFLADSISGFGDAHCEIVRAAGATETMPDHPVSSVPLIASLCDRAGPGTELTGDITAVFNLRETGGVDDEPIASALRGILDGHIVLDRKIAERGRFPAVDVLRSGSRILPKVTNAEEKALVAAALHALETFECSEPRVRVGRSASDSAPFDDAATVTYTKLDQFIAKPEAEDTKASFAKLERCLQK